MMKQTTFVADPCTLVLWGSFFFIWPAQVTLLKDWSSCPCLYLFLYFFFFFVCLFGWLLVLPVWCPWISGDGSDSLDTLLAWLRPDEPISQYCLLSGYPSLSRASVFYFCFDQIKTTSSPSWTRLHQCHVTLLDEATSRWLGVNKVKTFPPCRLQRPSLPLKPQGLNGTFTERKTDRRKLLTSTSFFSYFCITGCF